MNIDELRQILTDANKAYRAGTPIMSDKEFDDKLEELQSLISEKEYDVFRCSMHEVSGKIQHPYIMGSLEKLKAEEPASVVKWLKTYCHGASTIVSAKVDGISSRARYANGNLISLTTRGDGYFGIDITAKAKFIKHLPKKLNSNFTGDVRGELVIFKTDFDMISDKYSNPRNACAGIMNRKDDENSQNEKELRLITFVPYTILGETFTKHQQFANLHLLGFEPAAHISVMTAVVDETINSVFSQTVQKWMAELPYEIDGLVVCDGSYKNEEAYRPTACVAYKINQQIAETRIVDVAFDGPSKDGIHCPVAILDPVELGGATISRATLHNLDIISEMHLMYGSKVKLLRSGDVIPKIVELVENPSNATAIVLPEVCNCCGEPLTRDGVNLRCTNKNCKDQIMHHLADFIQKLGVKSASEKTLEKFGITSYKKLIDFKPNLRLKSQTKLYDELNLKVFTRSKLDLLCALNFRGLSETLIKRIVEFYGFDNIAASNYAGLPNGVGETTLQKFKDDILDNLAVINMLINDNRYHYIGSDLGVSRNNPATSNGMSVCFTGKLDTMSRNDAEAKAIEAGFTIGAVNKKLTYLVTNDPNTNSGKGKKARELGIKIISEKDFLKMVSSATIEQNLDEL